MPHAAGRLPAPALGQVTSSAGCRTQAPLGDLRHPRGALRKCQVSPLLGSRARRGPLLVPGGVRAQRDNVPARQRPSQCRAAAKKQPCSSALAGGSLLPRREALEIPHSAAEWGPRLPRACPAPCGHGSRLLEQRSAAALAVSEPAWALQRPTKASVGEVVWCEGRQWSI